MGRAVCLVAVTLATVAVLSNAGPALTIPLGAMLVLVLPGYAWLGAVRHHEPQLLANGALVVMASMGLAIVLGLELNLLPGGLTRHKWVAGLSLVTVTGLATSWMRGRAIPGPSHPFSTLRGPSSATGLKIIVVILLFGATGSISVASQNAWIERQHFSELALTRSGEVPVVYVRNLEGRRITYTVTVWVGRQRTTRFRVRLGSGRRFTRPLNATPVRRSDKATLKVTLDRPGAPLPYRTVFLRRPKYA
jgi:uncharacterized membrane protein